MHKIEYLYWGYKNCFLDFALKYAVIQVFNNNQFCLQLTL